MTRNLCTRSLLGSLLALGWAVGALAQPPCPAGQLLGITSSVAGPGFGTLTIRPGGGGGVPETFAGNGITVSFCVTCNGTPVPGMPASWFTVSSPGVVFCPGVTSNIADTPTNLLGCTTFSGTICGGGCSPSLDISLLGTLLATVPVGINSTDTGVASPGFVDAGDLAAFASVLGNPARYSICFDYNESGPPTINAGDLAYFVTALGANCGPVCP